MQYVKLVDMAKRLTRAESKQRTRDQLIASGLKLFTRKGFHATSLDEIAEAAGFSRGAFYANFTDKAELFMTILEETSAREMDEIARRLAATPDDDDKLSALQDWFDALTSNGPLELAYLEFWPQAIRDHQLRRRLARRQRATREAIARAAEAYLTDHNLTIAIPIDQAASMMLAIANGIVAHQRLDPDGLPADAFATTSAYLWTGLVSSSP